MQPFCLSTRASKAVFIATLATTVGLSLSVGILSQPSFASNDTDKLRQGLPGRRISGGVRGPASSCFADFNQSIVAILPRDIASKTSAAHPTFWFSTPEFSGAKSVEFELFDQYDEIIYTTQINMSDHYGVSEFQMPETAPALAIDHEYRWVLSIACKNGYQESSRVGVQGLIRRVDLPSSLAAQIESASLEEKLALYTEAQLWHEQVSTLVNLRRRNLAEPTFQLAWTALMESVGLSADVSSDLSHQMSAVALGEIVANSETTIDNTNGE
ncbi:MAG: DUF928 domain-containing protein [Phormidesmis sp. RL_2_1]|nr:DUF928 domain-containing protein [Phormidesmis sp. RL_2_1]